jgi:hypothetical protein
MKMAKKKVALKINLDAVFKIAAAADQVEKLKVELSQGKACLSVSIAINDSLTAGMSLYSDHFKSGGMAISSLPDGFAQITVKGEALRNLDPSFDSELISTLKQQGKVDVKCCYVYDNDSNDYYIDGNDQVTVSIGECCL